MGLVGITFENEMYKKKSMLVCDTLSLLIQTSLAVDIAIAIEATDFLWNLELKQAFASSIHYNAD